MKNSIPARCARFLLREKIFTALLIMFIGVSFAAKSFLTWGNINNLMIQIGLYGIVALGMTFAIIGGDFDLGTGSMVSCASVLIAILMRRMPMVPAILITLLFSTVSGFLNGILVAYQKINSFIVTFGSMIMLKGIALSLGGGKPISTYDCVTFNGIATVCGISLIFIIFFVLLLACHYILTYTSFGRNIYAIGGNYEVAKSTGIKVNFYKMILFVMTGLFAGIGGVLMASRITSGHPTVGDDMTMTVIAGVVIGGTSLAGGKGNVWRTLLGITVMMFLANAFNAMVIRPYIQRIIKGLIIILVVAFDSYTKKSSEFGKKLFG